MGQFSLLPMAKYKQIIWPSGHTVPVAWKRFMISQCVNDLLVRKDFLQDFDHFPGVIQIAWNNKKASMIKFSHVKCILIWSGFDIFVSNVNQNSSEEPKDVSSILLTLPMTPNYSQIIWQQRTFELKIKKILQKVFMKEIVLLASNDPWT